VVPASNPPGQLMVDAVNEAASPGTTDRKLGPVGPATVTLIATAVAPAGTTSAAMTAPDASRPSFTEITRFVLGAISPLFGA
jgi:hypothetical protein